MSDAERTSLAMALSVVMARLPHGVQVHSDDVPVVEASGWELRGLAETDGAEWVHLSLAEATGATGRVTGVQGQAQMHGRVINPGAAA